MPNNPDKYQQRALETWHSNLSHDRQMEHATMALVVEAAEYQELRLKHIYKPGHESTRARRLGELLDVFYYLCILAHLDDCTVDELCQLMQKKLKDGHGWQPDYYNGEPAP
jgi:hypothetical protein